MFDGTSSYADSVDMAMIVITVLSVIMLIGITAAMLYFVFKYSRKKNPKATQIHGNVALEIIWIVIPTIIVMVMFWVGFEGFQRLRATTDVANVVNVEAYMWGWDFKYENGFKSDTLFIPVDDVTRLDLISRDVNHSLYIPAFRLKEDVIGGQTHYMILTPDETGTYDIACAEYCGRDHSNMYTAVVVMEQDDYNAWLQKNAVKEEKKEEPKTEENVEPAADSTSVEEEVQALNMLPNVYKDKLISHPNIEMLKKTPA
jgi:cytochrome c oxidase subunit 2